MMVRVIALYGHTLFELVARSPIIANAPHQFPVVAHQLAPV